MGKRDVPYPSLLKPSGLRGSNAYLENRMTEVQAFWLRKVF